MSLDLNAERQKRSREPKHFEMRGDDGEVLDKFVLAAELPLDALDDVSEGKIGLALVKLFEDREEGKRFVREYRPTVDDFNVLIKKLYGIDNLGEP